MRIKYENLHIGDTITLKEETVSEGKRLHAGLKFIIKSFPPKIRKFEKDDRNPKGYLRDYFCYGITESNNLEFTSWPVRVNLSKIKEARNRY